MIHFYKANKEPSSVDSYPILKIKGNQRNHGNESFSEKRILEWRKSNNSSRNWSYSFRDISTRFSWAGARRITPIDLESSQEKGWPVYDEVNAFTDRGDDIIKWDVSLAYSWNKPALRQEIKLDIQNVTNNAGVVDEYFNSATNEIEYSTQLPMFPVLMYTLQF